MFLSFRGGLPPANCRNRRPPLRATIGAALFLSLFLAYTFVAQTQSPQASHGVIRLKVKYKSDSATKELARKRFFLLKGGVEENRHLIEGIKQMPVTSRQCYYRNRGASDALIKWLKDNDCESVYCREVEQRYFDGAEAVPEFQTAYQQALLELKNAGLASRWLSNYLPSEIRMGFYDEKQKAVAAAIAQAKAATKSSVMSVMTDRKGTAYFTNIEPGTYTISNLVASETEKTSILWICEREVKAVDLGIAMKRPFTMSNEKDPKVKCEVVERPLPVCERP